MNEPYLADMNFLAHLYLSGSEPGVMVGNFIGDFVKGRDLEKQFSRDIARGVALHRSIDAFTDSHEVVKQSKERLRPKYRHYAGVIVDIFYDHFLAAGWPQFSEEPLEVYAARAYQLVLDRQSIVPPRVMQMLPYMMRGNWLVNYAHDEGIQRVLTGMSRRTRFDSKMDESTHELRIHYKDFGNEFNQFFPQLKAHSEQWLQSNP